MEKVRGKDRLERKERKEGRTKSRTHNPNGFSMKAREREREREQQKKAMKMDSLLPSLTLPLPLLSSLCLRFFPANPKTL